MNPVFYEEKDCIGEANATRINTNNQKHTSCNPAEAIHNDNFGLKCGIGERKSKINISRKKVWERFSVVNQDVGKGLWSPAI